MVMVWWSTARLRHYNFLNLVKTITVENYYHKINEMQHKLQCRCPALVNRKGPILLQWKCSIIHCTTNAPEVELIRLQNCLIQHIHSTFQWLTTTYSSIAKISCNEKSPTSKLQQKMPSKNPLLPELHNSMLLE